MDALASRVVEFVPIYEIDTPTDAFDQLMRIYIMLTVNIPRLASKGPLQFDVAAEFEKVFGFSLADYTNFMFSLLLHALMERDARQANADPPSPVGPYWLKQTTLSEETTHKVLATVSFSLDAITPPKEPTVMRILHSCAITPTSATKNIIFAWIMSSRSASWRAESFIEFSTISNPTAGRTPICLSGVQSLKIILRGFSNPTFPPNTTPTIHRRHMQTELKCAMPS